jgi:Lhr-like helicase
LQPGDRFVLDGRCLELKKRERTALLVDEVWGRPLVPRWLGNGVPMPGDLARRIFLFRMQAAEALRDGDEILASWLAAEFQLDDVAITALTHLFHEQESVSEIPTLAALTIECVSMQACREYFVHTPLPRSANEAIARTLVHRWRRTRRSAAMTLSSDLGFYVLDTGGTPLSADDWRVSLSPAGFEPDFRQHLQESDLLAQQFARIAQTGLMVLRNTPSGRLKVGGRDWSERRLFDQIRMRCPDFLLLRQAASEAESAMCDLASAHAYVEQLAAMPICIRQLRSPSPLGECLLSGNFPASQSGTHEPAGVRDAS